MLREEESLETTVFWVGVAGMAIGALLFGLNTRRETDEHTHQLSVTLFFVPLIAAALYLAMALGQGKTEVDGRTVYYVRYITWFTTTPLLLNQLVRLVRGRPSLLLSLILADMFMIATGGVAELSPKPINYIWYAVSSGAFLVILVLLFSDLSRQAGEQPDDTQRLFRTLRNVTAITWVVYPLVWILGTAGINVIGSLGQTIGYTALDLASKVGFGLIVLANSRAVERSTPRATGVPSGGASVTT
jgi:sensory rhodopsin